MTSYADIENFIRYNPKIGVEGCHIIGFPGSGKSNLGNMILSWCLAETDDMGLMRGDLFAEWRHFTNYNYPIKILIPEKLVGKIKCVNFSLDNHDWESFDPSSWNIMDHMIPHGILVLYDAGFTLASKGWFWADVFEQLVQRSERIDQVITYLDHEAGVLFPEIALSESKEADSHWKAVNRICELFVFFRKALIRPMFVSQMESEINHRLRGKCLFSIIKKGVAGKFQPEQVRMEAPKQRVDQFIVSIGKELYTRWNEAKKFAETDKVWKMIPQLQISLDTIDSNDKPETMQSYRNNMIDKLITTSKLTQQEIADIVGLSQQRISQKSYKLTTDYPLSQ